MVYITLPNEDTTRPLPFYLAMEEYVAHTIQEDECFFMWQVEPTVIFGRNQLIENEVNLDYCREHHIHAFRRKSGGGCVYADMNNVMFSYITREENVSITFLRYINKVVDALRHLGICATATGRNDIMIGDKKVSGNAFYHIPGHSIVHGTMLYDTDMQNMVGSITPSNAKLVSKGIKSVRQHIALLKNYTTLDLEAFKETMREQLCDREIILEDKDICAIQEIEKEYHTTEFIYGKNPRYTLTRKGRIEGAGDFEVRMELKNGIIKDINIMGDFFLVGDIDNSLIKPLKGTALQTEALEKVLPEHLEEIIMNLHQKEFINLLIHGKQENMSL